MKKKLKKILAILCVITMLTPFAIELISVSTVEASGTAQDVQPVYLDGFKHVTISDFKDGSMNALADKTYVHGEAVKTTLADATTLDKTVVSMKVNFGTGQNAGASSTSAGTTGLYIAGKNGNDGFLLFVSNDGQTLHMQEAIEPTAGTVSGVYRNRFSYTAANAGVSSFLNNEILLQMSFEYTDAGTGYPGGNTGLTETKLYDLKIGMYINGKLYNNQKTEIPKCRQDKLGTHLDLRLDETNSSLSLASVQAGPKTIEPVYLDGFKHVTISDFKDGNMNALTDKTYVNGEAVKTTLADATTLDKTVVSMKVNFGTGQNAGASSTSAGTTGLYIAGKDGNGGFLLFVSNDGQTLHMQEAIEPTAGTVSGVYRNRFSYTAANAGVSSFLNNEILLQMSFEYTDAGTGYPGGNTGLTETKLYDVKVGMYINGKLYNNQKTEIPKCRQDKLGTHLDLRLDETNSSLSLATVQVGPKTIEPVKLDGFKHVTISDFKDGNMNVLADKTYVKGDAVSTTLTGQTTLDKTVVSMKVKFGIGQNAGASSTSAGTTGLYIAGKDGNGGFLLFVSNDGQTLHMQEAIESTAGTVSGVYRNRFSYTAANAGVSSFLNNEILLQMSFEYTDAGTGYPGGNTGLTETKLYDLKIGMYINGKLYNNQKTEIPKCRQDKLGTHLDLRLDETNSSLTLGSVQIDSGENEPIEELDPNLEMITFGHFGIRNGEYKINRDGNPYMLSAEGYYYGATYDGYVFSGDVTFGTVATSALCFGGLDNAWRGLKFSNDSTGNIVLSNLTGYRDGGFIGATFNASEVGKPLVGKKINLKLSFQYVDLDGDGVKKDVKLGVWFDNVLYDNTYIYLNGMVDYLGFYMGLYCDSEDARLTVASVADIEVGKKPDDGLTRITFADYGIEDGVYRINNVDANPFDVSVQGVYKAGNLDDILFEGNLLYSKEGGATIAIGGKDDPWHGFRLSNNENGRLLLSNVTGGDKNVFRSMIFSEQVAGTQLIDKEFNFKMSIQFEDFDGDGVEDDVKLGLWFNDLLYANSYLRLDGFAEYIGVHLGIFCETDDSSVSIKSYEGAKLVCERPNENFAKLTFSDFGITDGIYRYNNSSQITMLGRLDGLNSLDETIICGDILVKRGEGVSMMIGGKDNAWYGLRLTMRANGKWKIGWVGEKSYSFTEFRSGQAKAILTDEWLNLMVSTEVIDSDNDGLEDDLKVGFWFNGRLLQEEYFILPDCADQLGGFFGAYCETEGAAITVRSIEELVKPFDYTRYGWENNWTQQILNTGLRGGKIVGGSSDAAPFTGEFLTRIPYITGVTLVAIIGVAICIKRRRKRKQ